MDILIESKVINQGNHYLNHNINYLESEKINLYLHYWGGGIFTQNDSFFSNHSFYEVYYVLSGEGTIVYNNQNYPVTPGDLFILKPYTEYQLKDKLNLTMLFFAFEPHSLKGTKELIEFFNRLDDFEQLILNNQFNIGMLWKEILYQCNQQTIFTQEIIEKLAYTFIKIIVQRFYKQMIERENIDPENLKMFEPNAIIYNAKLFINDNLFRPLKLSEVADHLHISHRHLSRLFTKHLDVTFTEYVRSEKMNEAAILLATTDLPIKSVSQKVGFDTVHYFSSVFKKIMDIPPGEFRTRLQSD